MLSQQELKQQAADAALESLNRSPARTPSSAWAPAPPPTSSSTGWPVSGRIAGTVASSERSAARLAGHGLKVLDLNDVRAMPIYVDGADEINAGLHMIKGGGGALTREKIVASVAERFICIADESKLVQTLGKFPLPLEVIPMARESVARAMAALGGQPRLREGFVTDNGNIILDVSGLSITDAPALEARVNNLPGVVTCGLFALPGADVALLATQNGIRRLDRA